MINSCSSFVWEVQKKYLYKIPEPFYMSLSLSGRTLCCILCPLIQSKDSFALMIWKKTSYEPQQLEEKPAHSIWLCSLYGLLPTTNAFKGEELLPRDIPSVLPFSPESEICYGNTTMAPLICSWIVACILWKQIFFSGDHGYKMIGDHLKIEKTFP